VGRGRRCSHCPDAVVVVVVGGDGVAVAAVVSGLVKRL
jgi:hypothetical protein